MRYLKNSCMGLLLLCMSFVSMASAQAAELQQNCVTAIGNASMELMPDIAYVNINILGRADTAELAANEAAAKVANVRKILLGSGITSDKVETASYFVNPIYGNKSKIMGYQASHFMKISIDNIDKVGAVIDKLTASGADSINNVEFSISNQELLQRQLLGKALEDAKQQAQLVAAAAGTNLGKLVAAKVNNYGGYGRMYNSVMLKGEAANSSTVIETKNIKVSASLEASFALE